jgi:hypothetical protein
MFDNLPMPYFMTIDFSIMKEKDHFYIDKKSLGKNGISIVYENARKENKKLIHIESELYVDFWCIGSNCDILEDKIKNKIIFHLSKSKFSLKDLSKKCGTTHPIIFKKAIQSLLDENKISHEIVPTSGRSKTVYFMP